MIKQFIAESINTQVENINNGGDVKNNVANGITVAFVMAAIVAVILIIIGGVNYAMSQGDPSKTKKAKDTIIYSMIGLVVVALAFAIVRFIVDKL